MKATQFFCERLISHPDPLKQLGWQPFFQQQITLEEYESTTPARVIAHHRNAYTLAGKTGEVQLQLKNSLPTMTVGDWLLLDSKQQFLRLLDRRSLFRRKAPGSKVSEQLIAANIDTVFITCSLNHDFSLNRIERYMALAGEAGVEPVVVLTKADLCDNVEELKSQVQEINPLLFVETVNSHNSNSIESLLKWCQTGQTVTFMGSSGVGKSTLINTMLGNKNLVTGEIRENDSKGRHTTTSRSIHLFPGGGILMDTPGMREIQLTDCDTGISETFTDIEALATQCRFSDCQHQTEPGCAVQNALNAGTLDERRYHSYHKLLREQAHHGASLAEQRSQAKQFGKLVRSIQSGKRKRLQRD